MYYSLCISKQSEIIRMREWTSVCICLLNVLLCIYICFFTSKCYKWGEVTSRLGVVLLEPAGERPATSQWPADLRHHKGLGIITKQTGLLPGRTISDHREDRTLPLDGQRWWGNLGLFLYCLRTSPRHSCVHFALGRFWGSRVIWVQVFLWMNSGTVWTWGLGEILMYGICFKLSVCVIFPVFVCGHTSRCYVCMIRLNRFILLLYILFHMRWGQMTRLSVLRFYSLIVRWSGGGARTQRDRSTRAPLK